MSSRRAFLIGVASLVVTADAGAQPRNPVPRVGLLAQDIQPGLLDTFRDELRRLGHAEGKSLVIEVRNAEGRSDRLPPLVTDLPVVSIYKDLAEAGGLFAYGPDLDHVYRRAAHYVDRILRGSKPSELPVEQADTFHFVINLRTARTLGLTIPPSLLLRANQVIE
jgi:hypothetical protein